MRTNINLLPTSVPGKLDIPQLTSVLQKITTILGVAFLSLGLLAGGYMVITLTNINNLKNEQQGIVTQIEALETTEQQYVLVRDRVEKIKPILTDNRAHNNVVTFNEIVSAFPASVAISQAEVGSTEIEISLTVNNSTDLVEAFESLSGSESFSKVRLENFSFSPVLGYSTTVKIQTK